MASNYNIIITDIFVKVQLTSVIIAYPFYLVLVENVFILPDITLYCHSCAGRNPVFTRY